MTITISILKETSEGEKRVAMMTSVTSRLKRLGTTLSLQSGPGEAATFADHGYARELTVDVKERVQKALNQYIAEADMIVTTAAVPGHLAPKLISAAQLTAMRLCSVIVDLGAVTMADAMIGSISLTGSVIACAKLDGKINKPWCFGEQWIVNDLVFLTTVLLGTAVIALFDGQPLPVLAVLFFMGAIAFGILLTLLIGRADMSVVISLFNAFTGLAVALEGYALQNPALVIRANDVVNPALRTSSSTGRIAAWSMAMPRPCSPRWSRR